MATGNLILGLGRRSIGDVTLYRRNGQQVSRVRNRNVKNPKTDAQYYQRIIMNTVMQAYSRMKELTDHSFQSKTVGAANMSRFMQLNLNYLRSQFMNTLAAGYDVADANAFIPLKTKFLAPNEYIISEGSLPRMINKLDLSVGAYVEADGITPNATYGDIINNLGLQRGDQLTFVNIVGEYTDVVDGYNFYAGGNSVTLRYCRVILDPRNVDGTEAALTTPFLSENAINLPSPQNQNTATFHFELEAGKIVVNDQATQVQAFGCIATRNNGDGTFSYSPCQMVVLPAGTGVSNTSIYTTWNMQLAYNASQNESVSLSELYLRKALK